MAIKDERTAELNRYGDMQIAINWDVPRPIERPADSASSRLKRPLRPADYSAVKKETEREELSKRRRERIEDYGEHLGGARKDEFTGVLGKSRHAEKSYAAIEERIESEPLDEVFPAPNYKRLLESGLPAWRVALLHAIRDSLPRKPQDAFSMKKYVEAVKGALQAAEWLVSDKQVSPELLEFCSKFREWKTPAEVENIGVEMAIDAGFAAAEAGAHVMEYLSGGAGNMNLWAALYEHYGHDVSFKPVVLAVPARTAPGRGELFVVDRRTQAKKTIGVLDSCEIVKGFGGGFDFFAQGELERVAQSPKMQKWYEIEKEASARRAQEKSMLGGVRLMVGYNRPEDLYNIYAFINRLPVKISGPFASKQDAESFLKSHKQELAELAQGEIKRLKERTLAPRCGRDYRHGRNVTSKEFTETFGFRGTEFGNWVDQGRRQKDMNEAYDALMDLAALLDLPPKALSLNGTLGVGFGSRGRGRATGSAHYEPDRVVINLTKPNGPGCLAHEWMHAVDNYFPRKAGKTDEFASARNVGHDIGELWAMEEDIFKDALSGCLKGALSKDSLEVLGALCAEVFERTRVSFKGQKNNEKALAVMKTRMEKVLEKLRCPEEKRSAAIDVFFKQLERVRQMKNVAFAFADVVRAIEDKTEIDQRSRKLDKFRRNKGYFSQTVEEVARAFETYVAEKIKDRGEVNEYLAGEWTEEEKRRMPLDMYPYPLKSELPVIKEAFDKLFETIRTRETDRGIEMYSLKDKRGLEETYEQISISDIAERVKGAQVVDLNDGRFILRFKNNCEWLVNPARDHIDIDPEVVKRDYGRRATIDDIAVGRTCVFGKNAFIQLVSGMSSPATFSHEVFEASWGMLTKEEQKVLTDEYGTRENCAEHYAQFLEGRLESERSNGAVRKIFERIKDFFESLRCCLFGANSQDVFKRIESGAVMERNKSYSPELVYECTVNLADAEEEEYLEDLPGIRSGASFKDALEQLRDESLSEERSSDYGMSY